MKNRTISAIVLLCLALSAYAGDLEELIRFFREDTGRTDPLTEVSRYRNAVELITGMPIRQLPHINLQSRGKARQLLLKETLRRSAFNQDEDKESQEHMLRLLGVLGENESVKSHYRFSSLSNTLGMYLPETKQILVFTGDSRREMESTLFHELVHAAQDTHVDLKKISEKYGKSTDSNLALSALIEGQAEFARILMSIRSKSDDGKESELLNKLLEQLLEIDSGEGLQTLMNGVVTFPYSSGLLFVMQRYLNDGTIKFSEMFDQVPKSTEQILHHEKFRADEQPVTTLLEQRQNQLVAKVSEKQKVYATTLGEAFILSLFNHFLSDTNNANRIAASGWGGDRALVLNSGDKDCCIVWETVWDSEKDAGEFAEHYRLLKIARKSNDRPKVLKSLATKVNQQGRRVVVIEGNLRDQETQALRTVLPMVM